MQYFTGSKAHNIVLRDRAIQRGFKLNEYGLFRSDSDDERVAGETEEGIYQALGHGLGRARAARASRRDRGSGRRLAAAARHRRRSARRPPHAHDGHRRRDDLETMAAAAHRHGPPLHRHHRSQPGAGHGQRPRRASRARARGARARAERAVRRTDAARRHRMRHPARRPARSRGRLPGAARSRRRLRALALHARISRR